MTLFEQSHSIQAKWNHLKQLQGGSQQTSMLRHKSLELSNKAGKLPKIITLNRIYLAEKILCESVSSSEVRNLRNLLAGIKKRFEDHPDHSSLVQGNDWPNLTQQVDQIIQEIKYNCQQGWDAFTQRSLTVQTPQTLEGSIVRTDKNEILLEEFKCLYSELQILASEGHLQESIKKFKTKGKRLLEIAKLLTDFDAPDPVKKFLMAVSEGGATLELLTTEVDEWLKEQGLYKNFKIVGGA